MTAPLRFITCGSVDDGKSTLIGRLLLDSQSVLQDQLQAVQKKNFNGEDTELDLALFTDGLSAEREQGITIDVAYRYFSTPRRKFIIGDAPGHEQYTRNMVTAASNADCAVVLIDALKLENQSQNGSLLPQTRRHTLLAQLLGVAHIIFAVNKLDAVADAAASFARISMALNRFVEQAQLQQSVRSLHTVAISALKGWNVVSPAPSGWAGYQGSSLLAILESIKIEDSNKSQHHKAAQSGFALPVQWVEKHSHSADTSAGRRTYWGRLAYGEAEVGATIRVHPTGQTAKIAKVLDHVRRERSVQPLPNSIAGADAPKQGESSHLRSRGIVLDRELDVSRGDYLLSDSAQLALDAVKEAKATVAWLDSEPLVSGRVYQLLHAHRWVKAKLTRVESCLNIQTLAPEAAPKLNANSMGEVHLQLQEALPLMPYRDCKHLGSAILVDPANNRTAAAVLFS